MICKKEQCTACAACMNICPTGAISLQEDEQGFYQISIDSSKCIDCGACKRVCPIAEKNKIKRIKRNYDNTAYAVWNLNDKIRNASSSGGAFGILAAYMLERGGSVWGAAYQENCQVEHIKIEKIENLPLLQHSKYVQSKIGMTYKAIESDLKQGRSVLFSGCPCQVAGLYGYLGKEYEHLLTCELLCHGVPSEGVYQTYIDEMEKKYRSKIKNIDFRYKVNGKTENLKIEFENGSQYVPNEKTTYDPFFFSYMMNLALRESCHQCRFTNRENRTADFIIGDFWGLDEKALKHAPDEHASLVLLNSDKARTIFEQLKDKMYWVERTVDSAIALNSTLGGEISKPNRYRKAFLQEYVKRKTLFKCRTLKLAMLEFWCKMKIVKSLKYKNKR